MDKLTPELVRVLTIRIEKAIRKARFYPALTRDTKGVAEEVLRPYLPVEKEFPKLD